MGTPLLLGAGSFASTAYDADAQAYFTANSAYITSTADKNAINTFYLGLKSDGIYSKIKAMYLPIWGAAAGCKWNLVNPVDSDAAFRLTFATGWTFSSGGMTPNGTSAYANTFFNTNAYRNNNHLTYYIRTNVNETSVDAGVYVNILGGEFFDIESRISNVAYYGNHTTATTINYASTDSRGFHINTRTASNLFKVYLNSTLKGTNTTPTSAAINLNMYLGCRNTSGSPAAYSTKQCSFSSIGEGLTDTEAANFYTRVQTLMTYFGINV